jgi:Tfp pilus assembly PilM family ATPase
MPSQSESTKSMTTSACFACGHMNGQDRRFCGACGTRLWEPCVGCGQLNVVDLQFCGNCGVDLEDSVEKELQRLNTAVEEADRFAATGRFIDAIERLQGFSIPDHTELAGVASEIKRRIAEFPVQRQQAIAEARTAHVDALAFVEQRDDRRALARLNQVRPAFLAAEMRELKGQLESRIAETQRLKQEIQAAVSSKAYEGLLVKVARLSQLEPPSESLQKLAGQLRERQAKLDYARASRLLDAAEEALASCDYRKARAALGQFPEGVPDEPFTRRRHAAQECVWLADQLRTSPYVCATLIEIGRRLTGLQPHDARAAELSTEMTRRWSKTVGKSKQAPLVGPTWIEAPAETLLGAPVNFARPPKCLEEYAAREGVAPCKFLAAFGLALQGLGKADVQFNLAPREVASWREKVARLKLTKSPSPTTAWGLDFGAEGLKAVRLTISQPDKKNPGVLQIEAAVEIPLLGGGPKDQLANEGAPSKEAQAFAQLQSASDFGDHPCLVLGLPGVQSPVRLFKAPDIKPDRFSEVVHYEVRGSVPLGENELLYGSHRGKTESVVDGTVAMRPVIAVAASRTHVTERLRHLGDAAGPSTIVQSNCVALVNAMRLAKAEKEIAPARQVTALIDVGAQTVSVVVDEGGLFWFRGSYGGLSSVDNALAERLQLTSVQAAELRKRPEAAREMHRVDEILQTAFDGLLRSVERAFEQYQRERGRQIEQVYLCGGGAYQFGLLRHFWFGGA